MNGNQIIKPRLILSGLLILALLAVTLMKHNVFAADTPNTFEVETADELTTAIEQASGGDTIILNTWLNITESMIIGDDAKHLTIKKGSTDAHFNVMGGSDTTFKNMTFDGDNMKTYDPWLHINSASVNVIGCTFQNMGEKENESNQYASAGAVLVRNGSVAFSDCTFQNNSGFCGNIETEESTTATLNNCIISGGYAFENGGAINNGGTITLNDSLIYGNTAKGSGQDIFSSGSLIKNTDLETMAAMMNDSTKIIEGWKNEADDSEVEPLTTHDATIALKLIVTDAPTETPTDDREGSSDDPGEQIPTEDETGGETEPQTPTETDSQSSTDASGATDNSSGSSTNTEPTTPSTTTPGGGDGNTNRHHGNASRHK